MTKMTQGVSPWVSIWLKPRKTISQIVEINPRYRFGVLSFLYGCPMLLHMAQSLSLGETFTGGAIGIFSFILATFVGMLCISIASGLFCWTGKWIGGRANYLQVRAAVSWSNVPNLLSLIVWIMLFITFGDQLFTNGFSQMPLYGSEMAINVIGFLVQAVLSVWSFIILIKSLAEVQGFSAWKGLLNVLIPFFMVAILMWIISLAALAISGMIGT